MSRALTNLIKNAAESVTSGRGPNLENFGGRVEAEVRDLGGEVRVDIRDNGPGFPAGLKDRLTEPYVTTRSKGTGLGLAIVQKVMEEHRGALELIDLPDGGALVRIVFNREAVQSGNARPGLKEHGERKVINHGA
ncbi:MAG: hypothetical protein HQ511_12865 [Rhodospirillales bacterium]|nr:hypothetical protein [Rhodospirillales bacterium]